MSYLHRFRFQYMSLQISTISWRTPCVNPGANRRNFYSIPASSRASMMRPIRHIRSLYHLFGRIGDAESLVLTEDDYFDFLIEFWRDRREFPALCAGR